MHLHG
jgi:hypothetical protein